MPFVPVDARDGAGGNFPREMQEFFNLCGRTAYRGSLHFRDARHNARQIPIFSDDCLEDKPETYLLLRQVRRGARQEHVGAGVPTVGSMRSIHQNEHGYLPYKKDGLAVVASSAAGAIARIATAVGKLPHNQASAGAVTRGQFMEYTCGDRMHTVARLILDYRFGFVYITFGHYHPDSFALLVRSQAELTFEVMPTLPELDAVFLP